jgi:hypothetical protein
MEIRVNVPDELAAQAQTRGMAVEEYVAELLAERTAKHSSGSSQRRTPEQIRAWLDALAQFSEKIPQLPKAISREWIYQDRD